MFYVSFIILGFNQEKGWNETVRTKKCEGAEERAKDQDLSYGKLYIRYTLL
jgi:hypothetical protein